MSYPPAEAIGITASADTALAGGLVLLKGFSLRNTSSTAVASGIIRGGRSTGAESLFDVTLAENESAREWFDEGGILCDRGLFFDLVAGAITGCVFVIPGRRLPADLYALLADAPLTTPR